MEDIRFKLKLSLAKILKFVKFRINCQKYFFKKNKKKIVLGFDPQLFTNFTIQKLFSNHVHLKPIEINLIDKIHKIKKEGL